MRGRSFRWHLALVAAICALTSGPYLAQTREWPSEGPPRPLPAREVRFPPYEIKTFANGLQVVAVLHHEQPVVSMRLLVRAGSAHDPEGKKGLATLWAALLDQGTSTRSAQQIAETIDTIGGGLGTGAGSDLSFVNVVVMKDSFDVGLDLLADVVRRPVFAPEEIERQRQQIRSSLKVSYEDPDHVAGAVFDRLVYGFHPYGLPNSGTANSIEVITRDDLRNFHAQYAAPNNGILAIVGDLTAAEAFAGAARVFGDWPRQEIPVPGLPDPPEPTRRVVVIDKPDAVQTEIRVGHLGVPRKHPDHMALNLAIKILGGEGSNRLHRVLRSERGLTYGASADMETLKQAGDFVAETNTRSEATGEVLRLTVDEFSRLQRDRVGEGELGDAKAYLAGSFPLTIETPDAIATQVLHVLFYDLPLDELQTSRERVNAVTVDDLQRVARRFLKPDRLSVVLVGNASAFLDQIRGVGFGKFEVVPLSELDLTAADFKKPAAADNREPAVGPAPGDNGHSRTISDPEAQTRPSDRRLQASEDARARRIIDRVVRAKGGLDKLRGLKTVMAVAQTTLTTLKGPIKTETRTYIEYPDRFRVETKVSGAEIIQVYNSGQAWVKERGIVHDAPESMKNEFRAGVSRDPVSVLIAAATGRLRARALPDATGDGGKPLQVVELSGGGIDGLNLYVDSVTGLVVKQSYPIPGSGGREVVEEVFSDYRVVDGVQVAFKALVRRGAQTVIERTLTDFKSNFTIDPNLFSKPQ